MMPQSLCLVSRGQTLFRPRERVWDMAIEQLVTPHRGVCTNQSTVFSHMIPEGCVVVHMHQGIRNLSTGFKNAIMAYFTTYGPTPCENSKFQFE